MNEIWWYYLSFPSLIVAALLQSTVATKLIILNVKPDLVLVVVLIGALIFGRKAGIVWAFVGGIGLDLFSGGPFGASSLALMVAAVIVGMGQESISRFHWLTFVLAGVLGTLLYGLSYLGLLNLLGNLARFQPLAGFSLPQQALPIWPTLQQVIVPSIFYNTTLMLFVTPWLNRMPDFQEMA